MNYCGWRIYARLQGEAAPNEIPELKMKVKGWFPPEEWECEEQDSYTISLHHQSTKSEVIVAFRPQPTNVEITMGLDRFGVVFKSDYRNWWKGQNECLHQQLRDEVLHRIPWYKQAYELRNHELIPVPKPRLIRMRKRRQR